MALNSPTLYLLDTNMVAYIVNGRSEAARRMMLQLASDHLIAISAIVQGETLYGVARKPEAKRLRGNVEALFSAVSILPWDSAAAHAYGIVRARLATVGKSLSAIDMLIAAHAIATNAILVTHDKAFLQVEELRPIVDWATDLS